MRYAILYVNCFLIKSVNDIHLCEFPYKLFERMYVSRSQSEQIAQVVSFNIRQIESIHSHILMGWIVRSTHFEIKTIVIG